MSEPITIALLIQTFTAVAAVATVAVIAYLTITVIRNYLRERRTKHSVKTKPAVMVEELKNGNYSVMTGFFDNNAKLYDSKVWHAKKLDEDLLKFPDSKPVIIDS